MTGNWPSKREDCSLGEFLEPHESRRTRAGMAQPGLALGLGVLGPPCRQKLDTESIFLGCLHALESANAQNLPVLNALFSDTVVDSPASNMSGRSQRLQTFTSIPSSLPGLPAESMTEGKSSPDIQIPTPSHSPQVASKNTPNKEYTQEGAVLHPGYREHL